MFDSVEIIYRALMRARLRHAEWFSQKQREQQAERVDTVRLRQLVTGLTAFAVIAAVGFLSTFTGWNAAAQQRSSVISLAIVDRASITDHTDAINMAAFSADRGEPKPMWSPDTATSKPRRDPPESPKPSTPARCPRQGC